MSAVDVMSAAQFREVFSDELKSIMEGPREGQLQRLDQTLCKVETMVREGRAPAEAAAEIAAQLKAARDALPKSKFTAFAADALDGVSVLPPEFRLVALDERLASYKYMLEKLKGDVGAGSDSDDEVVTLAEVELVIKQFSEARAALVPP